MTTESPNSPPSSEPISDSDRAPTQPPKKGLELKKSQKENLQIVAIALILAVVIRLFIAEPRFIPSDSMVPTLQIGDRLVVEKVSYALHPPATGDIIVFQPPAQLQQYGYSPNRAFIKRIIGTPGDRVQIHDGTVYLNQRPLQEPYTLNPQTTRWSWCKFLPTSFLSWATTATTATILTFGDFCPKKILSDAPSFGFSRSIASAN